MKRLQCICAILLLATCALAQFGLSSMSKMQSSPAMALLRTDIKKELKLRKDQESQINQIEKDLSSAMSPTRGNDPTSLSSPLAKIDEANVKVMAVLDDTQRQRLFEIRLQMQGPPSVLDPDVSRSLALTDDQTGSIKTLDTTYLSEALRVVQDHPGKGTMEKIAKMRDDRDEKILKVLTDEQRAKFKEMQGTPFKDARPKGSIF